MKIETLFIDNAVSIDAELEYLLSRINVPPIKVKDSSQVFSFINESEDPVSKAKKTLFITRNKGAVIKECPGTSYYTCCDYTILHTGTFCTMDCSYCILQAYFHPPVLQYFAGFNMLENSLKQYFSQNKIFRIGTGEYTDSLIWEKISLLPEFLVKTFAQQNNCLLELKTKTVNIGSLLNLDHNNKTVLSWSLNTPEIIKTEEKGTASLKARLQAAKKAEQKGYKLAFHFDPIVIYPGCEIEYVNVIKSIFDYVRPENIVWVSLGSFRFMPSIKPIIEKRFPESVICYGEFIQGLDNKMRYFKPLRISIYNTMITAFRQYAPDLLLYFCMEDREVWEKCLGDFPEKEGELGHILDQSAVSKCRLDTSLL